MNPIRAIAATGAPLGGAGYLLLRFAPAPTALARHLSAPRGWIAEVGTDAAVASIAGTLLWLCALWVVIGLTAIWFGQLPGLAGKAGRVVAHCAVPVTIQRLVAASAGFSLLLGPATADAVGRPAGSPGSTAAASAVAVPGWPLDQPVAAPPLAPGRPGPLPTPSRPPVHAPTPSVAASGGWPLDPSSGAGPTAVTPRQTAPPQTTPPRKPPRTAQPPQATTPAQTTPAPTSNPPATAASSAQAVTVRPGDSLWTIAATDLGPAATDHQIAIAWPYWYRANRPLIGRDPNLVRPGTRLSRPQTSRFDESDSQGSRS